MELNNQLKDSWGKATDSMVIQAATKDWNEYPIEAQNTIEAEVQKRGLDERVSLLRDSKNKSQTTLAITLLNKIRNPSIVTLWILLALGCLLHILFSAEGIFYPWNWNYPISVIAIMVGYATPGILFSIIGIVPLFHYSLPKPRPKFHIMKSVIWAVYIGFGFRIMSHLISMKLMITTFS